MLIAGAVFGVFLIYFFVWTLCRIAAIADEMERKFHIFNSNDK